MSQAEHPDRLAAEHETTVEDVRQLMGAFNGGMPPGFPGR